MKKIILAASAAIAALGATSGASASVSITCPGIDNLGYCTFSEVNETGNFGDSFPADLSPQTFTDQFTFVLSSDFSVSITATKTASTGGTITITTASLYDSLNNEIGLLNFGGNATPANFNLQAGTYYLLFDGEVTDGGASFSGTIDIGTYVPEPATWAMMIAGITVVGASMRRRVRTSKVAFS